MPGEAKITPAHLDRAAVIYLRQSTLMQVREHGESTARQYGLAGEAARLGWPAARIEVIDCDLGLSGRTATHREGFRDLLGRVCAGEAGAIFGLEISRLARSNADLSRLLEVARLTDTLVIDADGIYDLADINDRLLLGLKGQMSEAELHLLHTRLDGARLAAASRGELRLPLPAGYLYHDGQVVKDPDEEVTAAITDMFAAFTAKLPGCGPPGAAGSGLFARLPGPGPPNADGQMPEPAGGAGDPGAASGAAGSSAVRGWPDNRAKNTAARSSSRFPGTPLRCSQRAASSRLLSAAMVRARSRSRPAIAAVPVASVQHSTRASRSASFLRRIYARGSCATTAAWHRAPSWPVVRSPAVAAIIASTAAASASLSRARWLAITAARVRSMIQERSNPAVCGSRSS
jgi:DNA invertase Pin-like site-specific DNA recombinase